jgi:hypothetical protein
MTKPWSPPAYLPSGSCICTRRHSPRLVVVETHHIVPLSWGGANSTVNKARVCPNTHYGTHALLNEYVRDGGRPPLKVLALYTEPMKVLAAMAWALHEPDHPTPYWLPLEPGLVHKGASPGGDAAVAEFMATVSLADRWAA